MAVIEDAAPALLEQLQQEFSSRVQSNRKLQELLQLINEGKATYIQAEELAMEIGTALSQTFGNCFSSATLPDGKMYYNIAQRVVAPMLREDHQLIAKATEQVQAALNKKAGIGLKPQTVAVDEDRIYGIVNKISEAEAYDDVAWVLAEPVVNFSQAVADSILKANVDFQGKAGLTPKIYRRAERKCCKWCQSLAGVYDYPMVPDDVYRRHERCRCTVDYDPGDGRRQNVHTKQWTKGQPDDTLKKRQSTGLLSAQKRSYEPDILIGKNLGAKAKNYQIMDLATGEFFQFVQGSRIQNVEVFAGKGSRTPFRQAQKYADRHGGKPEDWQHVKGHGLVETEDGDRRAEVHWVQCENIGKFDFFVKRWEDD